MNTIIRCYLGTIDNWLNLNASYKINAIMYKYTKEMVKDGNIDISILGYE